MSQVNNDEIYEKLRKHLDSMPVGYPKTKSGVEIRILKHFFTPEEAKVAIKLGVIPQPAEKVYRYFKKKGKTLEEISKTLDDMIKKGTINGGKGKGGDTTYYSIAYLAIGMFEYQVGRLTKDFAQDFTEYIDEAFMDEILRTKIPQLRTVPLEESTKTITIDEDVENKKFVSTFDEIEKIIEGASNTVSVTECICRQTKDLLGKGCSHPKEVCFQFGGAAHYYLDNGLSRQITKEEALKILRFAQDEGLVIQPSNTEHPFAICCCCGDSCEILSNAKKLDKPSQYFASNYYAQVDEDLCTGCAICETRCHMDAIRVQDDNIACVDRDRCIGCGVCTPTCAAEAVHLVKKKEEFVPPRDTLDLYQKIGKKKALLNVQKQQE